MKPRIFKRLTFLLVLPLLFGLVSCQNPLGDREYCEDLYISIPGSESQILIKEWQYLLGSGAEVYFVQSSDAKPQLLGRLSGGDDGYCPFKNGKYRVRFSDGTVTFSWSFDGSDTYSRSESFVLPQNSD